jgi:hypothetical protein
MSRRDIFFRCLCAISVALSMQGNIRMACLEAIFAHVQYNTLDSKLPEYQAAHQNILRNAGIGLACAIASASASNWIRVLKTTKQAHHSGDLSYMQVSSAAAMQCTQGSDFFYHMHSALLRIFHSCIMGIICQAFWTGIAAPYTGMVPGRRVHHYNLSSDLMHLCSP